ncbi:MAG: hypothetical protein AAF602_23280 [Myxococcota bacterium]
MIQLRGLRTGVEITGAEEWSLVSVPDSTVTALGRHMRNLGYQIGAPSSSGIGWTRVVNPDVWVHEIIAKSRVVGQFVMGSPSTHRRNEYENVAGLDQKQILALCEGVDLGMEYWLGFDDLAAIPGSFVLRGPSSPTAIRDSNLRDPVLNSSNPAPRAMAFRQGVFSASRGTPTNLSRIWQIVTDASREPVGYLSMREVPPEPSDLKPERDSTERSSAPSYVQQWWALEEALDGGLIPAGGDGEWQFEELPSAPVVSRELPTLVL